MKDSTKKKVEGTYHEVKGGVKQGVGKAINSPKVEIEGRVEETLGKMQKKVGKIEKSVKR